MADTKVSALTASADATAADLLYLVDEATTSKKITFANFEGSITHANLTGAHNLTTDIDHDALTNFAANEHIDWTTDQGTTNIHAGNYTDTNTTDHTAFSNIGTNTHAQVDTHIASGALHFTSSALWADINSNTASCALIQANTDANHAEVHALNTHTQGSNKVFMTNGATFTEVALGAAGTYLKSAGDDTPLVWDTPGGSGDVTAAVNLTDETLVQGDGGAKGVKTTTVTAGMITSNTASCALVDGHTISIAANTASCALIQANTNHAADNTQAHSDYLLNSGTDIAVGPLTITADNSTADQAYVPMVLYNTDETPPAASGFPVGTIYIQYTE